MVGREFFKSMDTMTGVAVATHEARMATDTRYADLYRAYMAAGSAVDAAHDGSLHHAYPADVADRMASDVNRAYEAASSAFYAYQRYAGATVTVMGCDLITGTVAAVMDGYAFVRLDGHENARAFAFSQIHVAGDDK